MKITKSDLIKIIKEEINRDRSYYIQVAEELKRSGLNPKANDEEIIRAAFSLMYKQIGEKKAKYLLNYDEDFLGDLISHFREMK